MIIINKSKRVLIYKDKNGSEPLRFSVSLGFAPEGRKTHEGDGKTPEGIYRVISKNYKSKYYISLGLGYPNSRDAKDAYRRSEIGFIDMLKISLASLLRIRPPYNTPLGGFIMIHGTGSVERTGDWTAGCIAVTNAEIDKLSKVVKRGERVIINE